ncbi:hypothetical protein Lser_V15G26173 [Lactuca serriola]
MEFDVRSKNELLAKERAEFIKLLQQAQSEAASAFGNDALASGLAIASPTEQRTVLGRFDH